MASHPAAPTSELEVQSPTKAPDLTINKIIAGAGAAATAAVLGSYLGAGGTVAGAAIGSVASTVATSLYQRSLDRTRETVVTRIRLARPNDPDITIPMQRDAEPATVVLSPVPPARPRLRKAVIATVVVFVLAMVAVTGLELAKGTTVTQGETGTSVGRVLAPEPAAEEPSAPTEPETDATTDGTEPTTVPAADPTTEPTPDAEPSTDTGSPQDTATPEDTGTSDPSVLDPLLPDAGE